MRRRKKDNFDEENGEIKPNDRIKKGIYLFPNLVTSGALMAGFFSICKTFDGDYTTAAWAIAVAMFFDGMDGKIARLTKTTSEFGVQYDSLSDLVSFGVAPGILVYNFALRYAFSPGMGWAIAFLFTACGALRLARFNVQTATIDGRWFVGVPIPAGASVLVFTVLFFNDIGLVTATGLAQFPNLVTAITLVTALAMVSTIKYWAFKDIELFRKHAFGTLFLGIICLAVVFREPQRSLFMLTILYLASGPVIAFFRRRNEKRVSRVI